jgi:uncharacterized membrane protein YfcA
VTVADALTLVAGFAAGGLGALLGIGGGILLVPLLQVVVGLSFREAAGVSLIGVVATSGSVASDAEGRRPLNVRLATVLLLFSVSGATFGASVLSSLSERAYERIFGVTAGLIAAVMLLRIDRRNIVQDPDFNPGLLGARFVDDDTRQDVAYRPRRLPVALAVASGAGMLASFVGVGGGIFVVPALNSWCAVPLRAAAATSAFMIGVTAVPGALTHYAGGYLNDFRLAGFAALGVTCGYQLGVWLSARAPVKGLKLLMAVLLSGVAIEYLLVK